MDNFTPTCDGWYESHDNVLIPRWAFLQHCVTGSPSRRRLIPWSIRMEQNTISSNWSLISSRVFLLIDTQNNPQGKTNEKTNITIYFARFLFFHSKGGGKNPPVCVGSCLIDFLVHTRVEFFVVSKMRCSSQSKSIKVAVITKCGIFPILKIHSGQPDSTDSAGIRVLYCE